MPNWFAALELLAVLAALVLDYLIYKYVRMEYEESKACNVLLKKMLTTRKRSTATKLIKEVLKQEAVQ